MTTQSLVLTTTVVSMTVSCPQLMSVWQITMTCYIMMTVIRGRWYKVSYYYDTSIAMMWHDTDRLTIWHNATITQQWTIHSDWGSRSALTITEVHFLLNCQHIVARLGSSEAVAFFILGLINIWFDLILFKCLNMDSIYTNLRPRQHTLYSMLSHLLTC